MLLYVETEAVEVLGIYQLLSGLSGMNKKEIAALPMNVFLSMIIDVIKKEEFKDFFQDVVGLFN